MKTHRLFTKEIDKKLFKAFEEYPKNGRSLRSQIAYAKIFNPYGRGYWYILNSDPNDPDYLWAIVDLDEVEVGSVSRKELENTTFGGYKLPLERDLYYTPENAYDVYVRLKQERNPSYQPIQPEATETHKEDKIPTKTPVFNKEETDQQRWANEIMEELVKRKKETQPNKPIDPEMLALIKKGIELSFHNGVSDYWMKRFVLGTKSMTEGETYGYYIPDITSFRHDVIARLFKGLQSQVNQNYFVSGYKYLEIDIKTLQKIGFFTHGEKTYTYKGVDGTDKSAEAIFFVTENQKHVLTKSGSYYGLVSLDLEEGYEMGMALLVRAEYVKDVDLFMNGLGGVNLSGSLNYLASLKEKSMDRMKELTAHIKDQKLNFKSGGDISVSPDFDVYSTGTPSEVTARMGAFVEALEKSKEPYDPIIIEDIGSKIKSGGQIDGQIDYEEVYRHFINSSLWATEDDDDSPLEENYDVSDVDKASEEAIKKKIRKFISKNRNIIAHYNISDESLGHDLFLTSRGHGVGFWDRGYGDGGDTLSESAQEIFSSDQPYVGDDGKIYFTESYAKGGLITDKEKILKATKHINDLKVKRNLSIHGSPSYNQYAEQIKDRESRLVRDKNGNTIGIKPPSFHTVMFRKTNESPWERAYEEDMTEAEANRKVAEFSRKNPDYYAVEKHIALPFESGGDLQNLGILNSDLFEQGGDTEQYYVVSINKDGYWVVSSKKTSRQSAIELKNIMTPVSGETLRIKTVEEVENHPKTLYERGGDLQDLSMPNSDLFDKGGETKPKNSKLVISASSKEKAEKMLNVYHYSTSFRINGSEVSNKNGILPHYFAEEKNGRIKVYRQYEQGGDLQDLSMPNSDLFFKGGSVKDGDIKVGAEFTLANGETIKIKKLFTENIDEEWVGFERKGEYNETSVKQLRLFINRWRDKDYESGGGVWTEEQSQKVTELDKEFESHLENKRIKRYSKEASDEWNNHFKPKMREIFSKPLASGGEAQRVMDGQDMQIANSDLFEHGGEVSWNIIKEDVAKSGAKVILEQRKGGDYDGYYSVSYGSSTTGYGRNLESATKAFNEYLEWYKKGGKLPEDAMFLEKELPSKLPPKNDRIELKDGIGEINVKPIPYNIKKRSTDEALLITAGNDELRPVMTGVFYDSKNKVKVSTDAHVMTIIPEKISGKSRIINPRDGSKIDGKFPNYEAVIPTIPQLTINAKLSDFVDQVNGVARANKFLSNRVGISISFGEMTDAYFNPEVLFRGMQSLLATGTDNIIMEFNGSNRALVIKDENNPKKLSLIMPVMVIDGNYNTIDLFRDATLEELIKTKDQAEKAFSTPSGTMQYYLEKIKQAESVNDDRNIKHYGELYSKAESEHKYLVQQRLEKINQKIASMKSSNRPQENIERDAERKALPSGKRVSADGNVYYESRENRSDKSTKSKPYLEDGGEVGNLFETENPDPLFESGGEISEYEKWYLEESKKHESLSGFHTKFVKQFKNPLEKRKVANARLLPIFRAIRKKHPTPTEIKNGFLWN